MDRLLKSNTVKRRVHSLFRQACLVLRRHPQHARAKPMRAHGTLPRHHHGKQADHRRPRRGVKNEGMLEARDTLPVTTKKFQEIIVLLGERDYATQFSMTRLRFRGPDPGLGRTIRGAEVADQIMVVEQRACSYTELAPVV